MLIRCECGWEKNVKDDLRGKKGQCPKCRATMVLEPATTNVDEVVTSSPPVVHRESTIIEPTVTTPSVVHQAGPAVQVNLQQQSSAAHSLGISSVILGILGLLICWIPLIGLLGVPLSGLGLLLGGIGLVIAFARKGSGIGFPVAGASICGLALLICFAVNAAVVSGAAGVAKAASDRVKARQEQEAADAAAIAALPAVVPENPAEPVPFEEPARPVAVDPVKGAGSAFEDDLAVVQFVSASVGKVPLVDFRGEVSGQSVDDLLMVRIRIINKSDVKKIEYRSWGDAEFYDKHGATMVDEFDNSYSRSRFGISSRPEGRTARESIYPEKSIEDVLVFDRPVDKSQFIVLKMPKAAYGGSGDAYMKISASSITKQ